ncbi:hypothetical protein WJX84_004095 [Apatococcus fuscideae]|uniref:Uncharacterized protein n=1 Tax=Apatococcus fuscideae TaxID=2026836 RepID=A0AAW1RNV8_9CHLO
MAVHPEPKSLFGKDVKGALLRDSARLQVDQQEDLLARMRYIVGPYASRDFLLGALCSSQGRLGFAVNIYFREVVMRLGAEPPDWQWNPRRPSGNSGVTRAPALSALMGSTAGQLPQSSRNDGCSAKQSDQQKQCGRCLDLHDWVDRNSQGGDDKQSQAQRDACSPAQLHRDPQVGMQHPIPLQHLTGSAGGQNPGMPPKHFPSAPEMEVTLPSQHLPSQSCCQMDSSGASEVLEVILGHAGARATCQAASTCKALCQAAASNEIWRGHTARRARFAAFPFQDVLD